MSLVSWRKWKSLLAINSLRSFPWKNKNTNTQNIQYAFFCEKFIREQYHKANSLISKEFSCAYFCKNSSIIFIPSLVTSNMFSWLLFRGKACKTACWFLSLLLLPLDELSPPLYHPINLLNTPIHLRKALIPR